MLQCSFYISIHNTFELMFEFAHKIMQKIVSGENKWFTVIVQYSIPSNNITMIQWFTVIVQYPIPSNNITMI